MSSYCSSHSLRTYLMGFVSFAQQPHWNSGYLISKTTRTYLVLPRRSIQSYALLGVFPPFVVFLMRSGTFHSKISSYSTTIHSFCEHSSIQSNVVTLEVSSTS